MASDYGRSVDFTKSFIEYSATFFGALDFNYQNGSLERWIKAYQTITIGHNRLSNS